MWQRSSRLSSQRGISCTGYSGFIGISFLWLWYHQPSRQVFIIFLSKFMRLSFSRAAATRSLSASCLLTSSAWLCVSFLILTSTRYPGGRACSKRTRTPSPITVAREQCETVGVNSTSTRDSAAGFVRSGGEARWTSSSLTTPRDSNERGCSGSEIGAIKSSKCQLCKLWKATEPSQFWIIDSASCSNELWREISGCLNIWFWDTDNCTYDVCDISLGNIATPKNNWY